MKFYKNQLNQLINLIKQDQIKALLLYGPDIGEIADITNNIAILLSTSQNSVEFKDVNNDSLYTIANNISFFSSRELIKIQNVTSSITEGLQKVLSGPIANFLVFIGDDLASSSSIRKYFESEKQLAILPCYVNDLKESIVIAKAEFNKYNKIIDFNALNLFCNIVGGLKNNIKNEVHKLSNYTTNTKITEDDILSLSYLEAESNPDLMCYAYIMQDKSLYIQELNRLLNNSVDPIWIIRAIVRYILNIIKVKKSNLQIDIAIKTLTPPIFFKNIPSFKKALEAAEKLNIKHILENLAYAEINIKEGVNHIIVLDKLFLDLEYTTKTSLLSLKI